MLNEYVIFCSRHGVTDPKIAAILPSVFSGAARKLGMTERGLLNIATYGNRELAEYLVEVAKKVSKEVI